MHHYNVLTAANKGHIPPPYSHKYGGLKTKKSISLFRGVIGIPKRHPASLRCREGQNIILKSNQRPIFRLQYLG